MNKTTTVSYERAAQALQQSAIPTLRRIHVDSVNGAVVITGRVSSYYYKQLAQETVLPVLDGARLVNQIVVAEESPRPVLADQD